MFVNENTAMHFFCGSNCIEWKHYRILGLRAWTSSHERTPPVHILVSQIGLFVYARSNKPAICLLSVFLCFNSFIPTVFQKKIMKQRTFFIVFFQREVQSNFIINSEMVYFTVLDLKMRVYLTCRRSSVSVTLRTVVLYTKPRLSGINLVLTLTDRLIHPSCPFYFRFQK